MEISFLYAIPRTAVLDRFFLSVTKIAGSYGQLWMIVAVVLLVFKKDQESRCRGASCLRICIPNGTACAEKLDFQAAALPNRPGFCAARFQTVQFILSINPFRMGLWRCHSHFHAA